MHLFKNYLNFINLIIYGNFLIYANFCNTIVDILIAIGFKKKNQRGPAGEIIFLLVSFKCVDMYLCI